MRLLIALLFPLLLAAQTTYTAATCNRADVVTAINSETTAPVDGDIISIPAGSCTWTGATVTATFAKSVTIQGAGSSSATTDGASTTGSDTTAITNNQGGNPLMQFTTTAGKTFRFTGIAILENASSGSQGAGNLVIGGASSSVRVDHIHIHIAIGGSKGLGLIDSVTGVADHVYIDTTQGVTNDFAFLNGANWQGETDSAGTKSWADGDHFGTAQFFYYEDTRLVGGYASDCSNGGRWVARYSTMIGVNGMANHGTHDGNPVPIRGCRAAEVYLNIWDDTSIGPNGGAMEEMNSGTALVWGNTTTKIRFITDLSIIRQSNATYSENIPPNGWGYCGNTQTGSTSAWDGNNTTNGYPCIDQPSRGQGDLLTQNATWPSIFDTVTSTQTWPHQVLSPVYVWNNTYNDAGFSPEGCIHDNSGILTENVDYYQQFAANCRAGSFNGTSGVGQGTLLPTNASAYTGAPNCTAGPGGNTPGVGYWDTTNQTLYVCNPTNTWSSYYTPYSYPHPLTNTQTSTPTFSPAAGSYLSSQIVSITSLTAGATICYTNDGTTPTANGSGTCVHGTTLTNGGTVTVSFTQLLQAVASKSGTSDSVVGSAQYTFPVSSMGNMFAGVIITEGIL